MIEQNDTLQTILTIHENMSAGYFMGDPLYANYYNYEEPKPSVEYDDAKNDIYLDENLDTIGFKIIDYIYAKPIENSFSFSGIQYEADNIIIFVAIMTIYLVLCLVFVHKDQEYQYSKLDIVSIVLNFITGIFVVPALTIICMLFGIVESHIELINQITYSIPPIAVLGLAQSVVLRRKGYSKSSFFIQFSGIFLFIVILLLDILA